MAKKVLILVVILSIGLFAACRRDETNIVTDTADTAITGGTTDYTTDTMITDTMMTDTMATGTTGTGFGTTDTAATGTTGTDVTGTAGTTAGTTATTNT